MTDRKALMDHNETPEDVATLYSWANLHGAKYRDFSASRAQTREKARQRVQDAIETEHRRTRDEAEAQEIIDAQKAADAAILAEAARKQEQAVTEQAQRAEQEAVRQRAWQQPRPDRAPAPVYQAPQALPAYAYAAPQTAPPSQPVFAPANGQPLYSPVQHSYPQAPAQPFTPPYGLPSHPQQANPNPYAPAPAQPAMPPVHDDPYRRDDHYLQVRNSWTPAESREPAARPAWLSTDRADAPPAPVPQAPEDTLQASRDRLTSRWFALNGVVLPAPRPG